MAKCGRSPHFRPSSRGLSPADSHHERRVMSCLVGSFDVSPNYLFNKRCCCPWSETPQRPCNVNVIQKFTARISHTQTPYTAATMGVIEPLPLQWRHSGRDGVSKLPAPRLFTQRFIQAQIKENIKAPRHWPSCGEFTGNRWVPRTNGQWRWKCFHLMTSSWLSLGTLIPICWWNIVQG